MPDPISPFGASGQISPVTQALVPVVTPGRDGVQAEGMAPQAASVLGLTEKANQALDAAKAKTEEAKKEASAGSAPMSIEEAAKAFREYLKNLPSDLQFKPDKESGYVVFKVVNPVTGEVIRQYPPDELLKMARSINSTLHKDRSGIFLDEKL